MKKKLSMLAANLWAWTTKAMTFLMVVTTGLWVLIVAQELVSGTYASSQVSYTIAAMSARAMLCDSRIRLLMRGQVRVSLDRLCNIARSA